MLSTLEYVNDRAPKRLAETFFKYCDKRMILFLTEIVINLLEGTLAVESKKPFLKYRRILQKLYAYGRSGGGLMDISVQLPARRTVLSSPKGLKLVKLLVNLLLKRA
jgi:hypothetical protein